MAKVGRKPRNEPHHDLHVQVNLRLLERTRKRADTLKIPMRKACEMGLELFLRNTRRPVKKPRGVKLAS